LCDIFTKNVTSETFSRHAEELTWTKEEYEREAETRILSTGRVLKGIEYNSSSRGKGENTKKTGSTNYTENCETEMENTEVANDKKVSFDNLTNAG